MPLSHATQTTRIKKAGDHARLRKGMKKYIKPKLPSSQGIANIQVTSPFFLTMLPLHRLLFLVSVTVINAQGVSNDPDCPVCVNNQLTDSFPHAYPGLPNPQYHYTASNSEAWQKYYSVDTQALPNATQCEMPSSYAGNVPVNRGSINNTLFYWAVENHPGSLTDPSSNEPWIIWLNGGPGSSSLIGLLFEHGPCKIQDDFSLAKNPYSWNTVTDVIYVDQPVAVGYATANAKDYAQDTEEASTDFIGFLANLVEVFPTLRHRPTYITGESYAGKYIPYIAKSYFETAERPVNLQGLVIADGYIGQDGANHAAMIHVLETYPQVIDYNPDAYHYFQEQAHLCGYDVNVTFPQTEPMPELQSPIFAEDRGPDSAILAQGQLSSRINLAKDNLHLFKKSARPDHAEKVKRFLEEANYRKRTNALTSRSLPSSLPIGTINRDYDCLLLEEVLDYAVNFTAPWSEAGEADPYYAPDALGPEAPQDAGPFLNDPNTVRAINAPTSKCWVESVECEFSDYPWGGNPNITFNPNTNIYGDLSPPASDFLSALFKNCSENNVSVVFLDGNSDMILSSASMLIPLQNTTFGNENIRGFTVSPQIAWNGPDGDFAGVVHQERGLKYLIFIHAGHLLGQWQPSRLKYALEQFVFGNNKNGSFGENGKLIGQEHKLFNNFNLPALTDPIFTGSGTTMGSTLFPSATIAAWESFIKTATLQSTSTPSDYMYQ